MVRAARPLVLVLVAALAASRTAHALPAGSREATEALALCQLAEAGWGAGRVELLTRGLELAEAGLRADPRDGLAHFALFCNLGRRLQATGLRITMPFEIVRALGALDDALVLAPDDPDVMTAKGALLIELPHLLGGDPEGAERWLRRALALDPQHGLARWYLNELLARRSAGTDAPALRASR